MLKNLENKRTKEIGSVTIPLSGMVATRRCRCPAGISVRFIKWKHFPRYWPFVRGFHRSPVNSPHKGMWRGALMFSLICARINGWVNNREAGDLRRHRAHYDVIVMFCGRISITPISVTQTHNGYKYSVKCSGKFIKVDIAVSQWMVGLNFDS